MVKVYYQRQFESFSLSDLNNINLNELIKKITLQSDPTKFGLTYCGKRIKQNELNIITDDDCIRIIHLPEEETKTATDEIAEIDEIDRILTKIKGFLKKYGSQVVDVYHNETAAGTHVQKFIAQYPNIKNDPVALSALTDFYVFLSFSHANWTDSNLRIWLKKHPEFFRICDKILDHILNSIYSGSFAQRPLARLPYPQQNVLPPQQPAAISSIDLQSALAAALGQFQQPAGLSSSSTSSSSVQPVAQPTPAPIVQENPTPITEDYSQQLSQLREIGFDDEQLCLAVLQQSNGDVQLALELIVEMMQ